MGEVLVPLVALVWVVQIQNISLGGCVEPNDIEGGVVRIFI